MAAKNWSISTTVRNPDRIRGFLKILTKFEGKSFNTEIQKTYQKELIRHRLYKPTYLPQRLLKYYDHLELPLSEKDLNDIFSHVSRQDLRGRTSVSPLNHMGLAVARQAAGAVKITELGKEFLKEEADLGEIFFRHFIKWQFPNPSDRTFTQRAGFNIKPFITTLHVINSVNKSWKKIGRKPVGISKEEFAIFVPTLINYRNINSVSQEIVNFRRNLHKKSDSEQRKLKESFIKKRVAMVYQLSLRNDIERQWNNLRDYADSIIRYFRLTRYFYIRGDGRYVDLSPQRRLEIDRLLQTFSGKADEFTGSKTQSPEEQYLEFLSDLYKPVFPWENINDLLTITQNMLTDIKGLEGEIDNNYPSIKYSKYPQKTITLTPEAELKEKIKDLRSNRLHLLNLINQEEAQRPDKLEEYISKLESLVARSSLSDENRPLMFEWYATLSLRSLNDALEIKPNYQVGDDNVPIFTAPSGKPDIECFYLDFIMGGEVTLLRNRSQWVQEGQPVQRHIRDLENQHQDKPVYGLFIAPLIHRDTQNLFWTAIKYEYEGKPLKIIPLSLPQYIKVLKFVLMRKSKSKTKFSYEELRSLLEQSCSLVSKVNNSQDWLNCFDKVIDKWGKEIISVT